MPTKIELVPGARWVRAGLAAGLAAVFAIVVALPSLPKSPSLAWPCGFHFLTGLPCLFCGGTRAVRALGHGQWELAAYLNPLAFPAAALGLLLIGILSLEAATGHPVIRWEASLMKFRRWAPLLLALGFAWWLPHILMALEKPKSELVDLRNPVAAALRSWIKNGEP